MRVKIGGRGGWCNCCSSEKSNNTSIREEQPGPPLDKILPQGKAAAATEQRVQENTAASLAESRDGNIENWSGEVRVWMGDLLHG